ncbi:MAG: DNA-3-methyladenine glycosylase [Actinomycetota bacterium]|nr:DNA-3-methyladenine glycosylase [Actinomycetota bacterium]
MPTTKAASEPPKGRFLLEAKGAYSLAASVNFLEGFAPAAQRPQSADAIQWTFLADDLESAASVRLFEASNGVRGEVLAGDPRQVRSQIARVLSLEVDGAGFPEVGRRDPVVGKLQDRYTGLRPVLFFTPWEAAVWALISQRIRIRQAVAIRTRLADELGRSVTVDNERVSVMPGPAQLRELDSFSGLSAKKIENLHALAEAAEGGVLDAAHLRSLTPEQALDELKNLPGVGPFSAQLTLLRGAGGPDYPPLAEPRMQHAVALAYGIDEPSQEELGALAEGWEPYRTWVTFLLRVLLEDKHPVFP